MNFLEFNLNPQVLANLEKLKIVSPNHEQREIIPMVLSGKDCQIVAPTGSGKTLTYVLPILQEIFTDPNYRALILVPTKEVAEQVFSVFEKLKINANSKIALVSGGGTFKEQASALRKIPNIIITTPGRLLEHLKNNKLLLQNVKRLVIDEADRLLDKAFLGQIQSIKKTMRGDWQTLMFSATQAPFFEKIAAAIFKADYQKIDLSSETKLSPLLTQKIYSVDSTRKRELLLHLVQEQKVKTLVFSYDQFVCENIEDHLKSNGISCDAIHGKKSPAERSAIIQNYRNGKYQVLVTTDLLARGLDFENIGCVINFDLPADQESYIHRVGRTARAGARGLAISLVAKIDENKLAAIDSLFGNAEKLKF